jgi:hypothetical protein
MDVEGEILFPEWLAKQGMDVLCQSEVAVGIDDDSFCAMPLRASASLG